MGNLIITTTCNRKCRFCFAEQRLGRGAAGGRSPFMPVAGIRAVMDLLERGGERELRLLGGEPTLHPEFIPIVEEAIGRGFTITLFSNGLMTPEVADLLARLSPEQVSVLCNVSPQAADSERQRARLHANLEKLGPRARLGVTLTEPEMDADFLVDYVNRFKLTRRVRLGIAQPIVGKDNEYLSPARYREAGGFMVRLAERLCAEGILLGFDCGLTLCMFSEAEIGRLFTASEGFVMHCAPIIDIGTGMDVWHCFPLSQVLVSRFEDFTTRSEMVRFYSRATQGYRSLGCKPECLSCRFLRTRQCTGGCLAHAMNSLNRLPPATARPQKTAG